MGRGTRGRRAQRAALALLGLLAATPGFALYKVVGPDGKVSYTDQPPQDEKTHKVQPLAVSGGGGGSGTPDAALPFELRQVVRRYPVTLYTAPDCAPCDSARKLLRQRGVPHSEKSVTSSADGTAFKGLGGQTLPMLQIGAQQLRSFSEGEWNRYLDAATYPSQSRLPTNYQFAAATPLAPQASAPVPLPTAASPAPQAPAAPPPPTDARGNPVPGFRF